MLRAVPDPLGGLIVMAAGVAIFFVVPWLDRSNVASIRYKGVYSKLAITLFVASFITLGYLGTVPVTEIGRIMSVICTFLYFAFFLLMHYTSFEKLVKYQIGYEYKTLGRINLLTPFITIVSLFIASSLFSAEGGPCKDYGPCDEFKPELNNLESLQRGASIYLNYCYGCHSLQYSRWGRVANTSEIPEDIFIENLVLDRGVKMGDLMVGSDKELSKNGLELHPLTLL